MPFLGKRLPAVELFLFGVKKEPKKRHRSDAVDAGWGCGFLYRARHDIKNNTKCWFRYWSAAHSGQWLGERLCPVGMRPPHDGLFTGLGAGEQGMD